MTNVFMEEFKNRLTKGLIVGGIIILLMLLSPLYMGQSTFSQIPWYLVPVVLVVTALYGTGWCFAFNLIKRAWRKLLRVSGDASFSQAIAGHGLILGLFYAMICFVGGCFLAFIVGNIFMIIDFFLALNGKPPYSVKFKFDGDKQYDDWARRLAIIENAVDLNQKEYGASDKVRMKNAENIQKIKDGEAGTITTVHKEGSKTVIKETTIK